MASVNGLFRRKTNENRVHWRRDSSYQPDDCKTFAPRRVNKGCESRASRWPFLFAASPRNVVCVSSSTLPSCLGGSQGGARREWNSTACIYSSPYFPSILTRQQTVVINFISDCLSKALANVTGNLTVEIIVDNPRSTLYFLLLRFLNRKIIWS